jgi:tetratricopeptide (TPR) repeat protein
VATARIAAIVWLIPPLPPDVVVPEGLELLEPQVREHIVTYLDAARAKPSDPELRARLGLALGSNGLWLAARHSFESAAWLDPAHELAHYYHAIANQTLGDYGRALEILRDAAVRFPDFATQNSETVTQETPWFEEVAEVLGLVFE